MLILLFRFDADAADLAYYGLVIDPCPLYEPLETLIHVCGYAEHMLFETVIAHIPPTAQASNRSLLPQARLASAHERVVSLRD
jgi:hypothetical protein